MFIDPASNVSVPLTVVTRTLVRAEVKFNEPEPNAVYIASDKLTITSPIHILFPLVVITTLPCRVADADAAPPSLIRNPEVYAAEPGDAPPTKVIAAPKYPDTTNPLAVPSCIITSLVPDVDTPDSPMVIRPAQLGTLNSINVPLVLVIRVPSTSGYTVPVLDVIVPVDVTLPAMAKSPEVEISSNANDPYAIVDSCYSYMIFTVPASKVLVVTTNDNTFKVPDKLILP